MYNSKVFMCTSVYCLRSALVCVIIYIYHLHVKAVGNMDSHYQIHTYIHLLNTSPSGAFQWTNWITKLKYIQYNTNYISLNKIGFSLKIHSTLFYLKIYISFCMYFNFVIQFVDWILQFNLFTKIRVKEFLIYSSCTCTYAFMMGEIQFPPQLTII